VLQIKHEELDWLQESVTFPPRNNLRTAHLQLIAFTTHRLDKHRQVKFTTATHLQRIRAAGFLNAQTHVRLQFLLKTLTNLTNRNKLTVLTGKRAVVRHEVHAQSRLINLEERKRFQVLFHADSVADKRIIQA